MEQLSILIEGSARHVHVTCEALETLFGKGAELHNVRELSQPGQYLTEERVRLEGPKGAIDRVSILGPERPATQVEISLTDARSLGITIPVRESGDVKGSGAVKIIGPAGSIELTEGAIAAKRHLHLTPETAEKYGFKDKSSVSVTVPGERSLVFNEVVCRVSASFENRMHIDTDEINAAGISGEVFGTVVNC